jgi:hypothetical protein
VRARGGKACRQGGVQAGRQAGASARKNGARICPCRRRPRCRVVDGCGTAAGAGILRNRLSMLVSFCRPRFPRLRAVLAGAQCSPAGGARRRRRAMLGLTAPWTSHVRAEACRTPIPKSALDLWKSDAHGDVMQHELTFVLFDPKCVSHAIATIESKSNICIPQKIFFCIISMKHAAFFGQRGFVLVRSRLENLVVCR